MERQHVWQRVFLGALFGMFATVTAYAQPATDGFATLMARMKAAKAEVMQRQQALLNERYDLSNRPAAGITMSRGKPVQEGVRAKLPPGVTWERLAAMTPEEIRDKGVFPKGFLPLPHPNHPEGGMLFPQFHIDEIKRQEGRDLTRFDLDYDLPDHLLPEFPAPIYLTTRPDLGDVSKGKLVTIDNYYELFSDPQSQTDRGSPALGHAVPAPTIQSD
jgi:cytochrome c peroxidase